MNLPRIGHVGYCSMLACIIKPADMRTIDQDKLILEYTAGTPGEDKAKAEVAKRGEGLYADLQASGYGGDYVKPLEDALQITMASLNEQRAPNKELLKYFEDMQKEYEWLKRNVELLRAAQRERGNAI